MLKFLLADNTITNNWVLPVVLLVMLVLMLVLPTISNRKRTKQYHQMLDDLKVGDKVMSTGGIIGRIVKIQDKDGEKTVFIETGDKKQKTVLEFNIGAIAGPIVKVNPVSEIEDDTKEIKDITDELDMEKLETIIPEPDVLDELEKSAKEMKKSKPRKK